MNKRLLAKGKIRERVQHFEEIAYEFSLVAADPSEIYNDLKEYITNCHYTLNVRADGNAQIYLFDGHCFSARLNLKAQKDNYSLYRFQFTKWRYWGGKLHMEDDMNQLITHIEQLMVSIDPMAWVRDELVKIHILTPMLKDPMDISSSVADKLPTPKAAETRGISAGYLADRLKRAGLNVVGGTGFTPVEIHDPFAGPVRIASPEEAAPFQPQAAEPAQTQAAAPAPAQSEASTQPEMIIPEKPQTAVPAAGQTPAAAVQTGSTQPEPKKDVPAQAPKNPAVLFEAYSLMVPGPHSKPFSFAQINNNYELIAEPHDHGHDLVNITGIAFERRGANDKAFAVSSKILNNKADLYVTDSRVVVVCRDYNKGSTGRWVGGLTAIGLNQIHRAVENKRRANHVFVAMLRYEWLANVMYLPKQGILSDNKIALVYEDKTHVRWRVTFFCKGGTDVAAIANDILHRTCRYRLAMTNNKTDEQIEFFNKYAHESIAPANNKDSFSNCPIIHYYYAPYGEDYRPEP